MLTVCYCCVLLLLPVCSGNMLGWLFAPDYIDHLPEQPVAGGAAKQHVQDGGRQVPFEVLPADEKFLQDATKATGLHFSEQEKCQHKIFLSMGKSCGQLSEEEMSKVAVQLLNCQSAAENRRVYPCHTSMSIGECTSVMDADTWNAYHIVSNRARAVCYATRQQQFRASAEIAVNRLTHQAYKQVERMSLLEQSHVNLEQLAAGTIQRVSDGQEQMISQQVTLQAAQKSIETHVAGNLEELSRVRSAIGVSQADVIETLRSLRETLARTGTDLLQHSHTVNSSHQRLQEHMSQVYNTAVHLSNTLHTVDDTTRLMMTRFDALMNSLQLMNSTIFTLLSTLDNTQQQLNNKLSWLTQLLGSDVHGVSVWLQHAGFTLLSMLLLTFVHAPVSARVCLLVTVPCNVASRLQHGPWLQFSDIVTLLLCVTLLHHATLWLVQRHRRRVDRGRQQHQQQPLHIKPADTFDHIQSDDVQLQDLPEMESPLRYRTVRHRYPFPSTPDGIHTPASVNIARARRISGSSNTSMSRAVCAAICRNGLPCRNSATYMSVYCGVHGRNSRESTPAL